MISLIKSIANSRFAVLLRNTINIKPTQLHIANSNTSLTISDAFLWRTDNGFKTKFKFLDILNIFYNINNSWVEIHIFSKNNELLKILNMTDLNISNEFLITKEYLEDIEDYGVFYIYHFTRIFY